MKYILISDFSGDEFKEFNDMNDAIRTAKDDWWCLSDYDKERTKVFFVLESVNPDEEAVDHLDGKYVWSAKCQLIANVQKWVDGTGIVYTSEYSTTECCSDLRWEDVDNSWADNLLDERGVDTSCERFKVWYTLLDQSGEELDESGYFWVEAEDYRER